MLILAADTSSPALSLALGDENRLLAETYVECGRAHSERMLETIDWLLNQAGIAQANIEGYAVSVGPGSFTGLRIGVATLKGLALAHAKPLVGVANLPAMARGSGVRNGTVCPLLDARMNEVFGAVYSYASGVRSEVVPMQAAPIQTILEHTSEDTLFIGQGAREYAKAIQAKHANAPFGDVALNHPRAGTILAEARDRYAAGESADPGAVAPIYLRGSQAEEARKS